MLLIMTVFDIAEFVRSSNRYNNIDHRVGNIRSVPGAIDLEEST
jgi:hypothetical protein